MGRRAGDFAGFCWWMFCGSGCLVGLRSWSLHVLHWGREGVGLVVVLEIV